MPAEPNLPTNRVENGPDPAGDWNAAAGHLNGLYRLPPQAAKTAAYTAQQSDSSSFIPVNSASSVPITLPQLLAGSIIQWGRKGAGAVTFVAGSGVVFAQPAGSAASIASTGSVVTAYWESATSVWLEGGLT